ncbi:unnamed protein product [Penicillium olsonii]|nr:unnamed protein product [Penicillium olsonii]
MLPELKNTWTPAINILTWFMLVTSTLSVLTRLGTKLFIFRKLTIDDGFAAASMALCIGQSIAVSLATANGLGQHKFTLSESRLQNMMKAEYAATILFIASISCSKLSLIIFIRNLTPASLDRRVALALGAFIGIWAVVSIFTASFQCHLPQTWNYMGSTCFDRTAWWNYLGVANILSEGGIIAQALLVIIRIQTNVSRKASLSSVFLIRIVVIIAIICQLANGSQTLSSSDPTFDTWKTAISTQMAQALSIVTACSPQFKPVLDNLRSSGMSLELSSSNGYGSKHKTYGASTFKASRRTHDRSETHELVTMPSEGINQTMVTSAREDDSESQSSRSNIIVETRTWTVTEVLRD